MSNDPELERKAELFDWMVKHGACVSREYKMGERYQIHWHDGEGLGGYNHYYDCRSPEGAVEAAIKSTNEKNPDNPFIFKSNYAGYIGRRESYISDAERADFQSLADHYVKVVEVLEKVYNDVVDGEYSVGWNHNIDQAVSVARKILEASKRTTKGLVATKTPEHLLLNLVEELTKALNLLKPIQAEYFNKGIPRQNVFELDRMKRILDEANKILEEQNAIQAQNG